MYIATWNHLFSNTSSIEDAPCSEWNRTAQSELDNTKFVNNARDELEEEYKKYKINFVMITATCPVDLIVTDPESLMINKTSNEIPNAIYIEADVNGDGELDDQIIISD